MANVDDTTLQACLHTSEPASLHVGRVSYSNRKAPKDEGGKASSFQEKKTLIHSEALFEEAGHWLPSLASRFDTILVLPRSGQSWSFWPSLVEVMRADSRCLPRPPFVSLEPSLCLSTSHASLPLFLQRMGQALPSSFCRWGQIPQRCWDVPQVMNVEKADSPLEQTQLLWRHSPVCNGLVIPRTLSRTLSVKLSWLMTMSRRHVPFLPEGHVPQKNKTNKTSTTKATF